MYNSNISTVFDQYGSVIDMQISRMLAIGKVMRVPVLDVRFLSNWNLLHGVLGSGRLMGATDLIAANFPSTP